MDNRTVIGKGNFLFQIVQLFQPQNVFGKNNIRVTHPVFHRTGRQLPRPRTHRRFWRRRQQTGKRLAAVKKSRPAAKNNILQIFNRNIQRLQNRFQTHPPAGLDHRRPRHSFRPGQINLFIRQQLAEIISPDPDRPLRQRKTEFPLHRPRHPGIGRYGLRPDIFIHFADNNPVKMHQTGFYRPQNAQARMGAVFRTNRYPGHQCLQQTEIFTAADLSQNAGFGIQIGNKSGSCFSGIAFPQNLSSVFPRNRSQNFRRFNMQRQ